MGTVSLQEHVDMVSERRSNAAAYRAMNDLTDEIDRLSYDDISDTLSDLMADAMFDAGVEIDELGDANMREATGLLRRKVSELLTEAT